MDLLAGETYLNFHTSEFPSGEVRGQLVPIKKNGESLLNFSTRGMVNPGNGKASLLIGGLALDQPKTVLFRMVGDSLSEFGVQNSLKDTTFSVYKLDIDNPDNHILIGGNDNWKSDGQQYKIAATG